MVERKGCHILLCWKLYITQVHIWTGLDKKVEKYWNIRLVNGPSNLQILYLTICNNDPATSLAFHHYHYNSPCSVFNACFHSIPLQTSHSSSQHAWDCGYEADTAFPLPLSFQRGGQGGRTTPGHTLGSQTVDWKPVWFRKTGFPCAELEPCSLVFLISAKLPAVKQVTEM